MRERELNAYDYYVFFDDYYLSWKETESKLIKRKGFHNILTAKRTEYLLSYCRKKYLFLIAVRKIIL